MSCNNKYYIIAIQQYTGYVLNVWEKRGEGDGKGREWERERRVMILM